ncbi:hypothetical protein Sjap_001084 [Stephania japonica]|uniref:Uncharacterized protein n=1 Tax=Stephania japonica TaxID=461633 RepID=A0AAP0KL20_9MAGN
MSSSSSTAKRGHELRGLFEHDWALTWGAKDDRAVLVSIGTHCNQRDAKTQRPCRAAEH